MTQETMKNLINKKALEVIGPSISGCLDYLEDLNTLAGETMYMAGADKLRRELLNELDRINAAPIEPDEDARYVSVLCNTIEQMAATADDKGEGDFGIRLTMRDARIITKALIAAGRGDT